MPVKKGRFEILGFTATVSDPTAASQIQMWDDESITDVSTQGNILTIGSTEAAQRKTLIANIKGIANADACLEVLFPEHLKTRRGISVATSNIVGGSFFLYVK